MKTKVMAFALSLLLLCAGQAIAGTTVLFSDNFDSENGGVGSLNYAGFTNWTVSNGTVDLIGNGFFDLLPGNGLYIDMDGSTNDAGKITSKATFMIDATKTYRLEYYVAGNQRALTEERFTVSLEGIGSSAFFVTDPFTMVPPESMTLPFTQEWLEFYFIGISGFWNTAISFEGWGSDNVGLLLDNVRLLEIDNTAQVPEPTTMLLLGLGLLGLAGVKKRMR